MQTLRDRATAAEKTLLNDLAWTPRMLDALFESCRDLEDAVATLERSVDGGLRGDDD